MTWTLAEIYRHPVKSLGEQALDRVLLETGRPMPFDRVWAIAHGRNEWDDAAPSWLAPGNLVNQTHVPQLAQIEADLNEATGMLTLRHPDRPFLRVQPGTPDGDAALTEWVAPLADTARPGPYRVCSAPGVAFTDFEDTHISIASTRSRAILEQICGQSFDPIRFRMNLWLDGMDPWAEFDLVGHELEIGAVRLRVIDRCQRCNATNASPETGQRDAQIPSTLRRRYGHMDFGVYAQVVSGGEVKLGDFARAA
ncbi:MAG: MOSC N-terminal beta barrel domain-containing protein [Pseudomonadota bacterium]